MAVKRQINIEDILKIYCPCGDFCCAYGTREETCTMFKEGLDPSEECDAFYGLSIDDFVILKEDAEEYE